VLPSVETDPNIAAALAEISVPDLPVYLINGCANPSIRGQPESFYTTDPARRSFPGCAAISTAARARFCVD